MSDSNLDESPVFISQNPVRRSFSFSGVSSQASAEEENRLKNETKLFSRRKIVLFPFTSGKNLQSSSSSNNNSKPERKVNRSSSFSSASPAGVPPKVDIQNRSPLPPRADAPSVSPIQGAALKLISAGLNLFKGINSHSGEFGSIAFGAASTIGRRPYMEDRHLCDPNFLGQGNSCFFGVFDGHGGENASTYCIENIPVHLKANQQLLNKSPEEALKFSFEKTDQDFTHLALTQFIDDGTTAVVAYIRDKTIWVANAGDSRCILSRSALAVDLSEDHKPNLDREHRRILSKGGFIKFIGVWRVQGVLAVTRSIGDCTLKPFVIPTPDITKNEYNEQDEFIVLASDGLWDVMKSQEVVDFLHLRPNLIRKPENAARALVTEAFRKGSQDNITVVVVTLNHVSSLSLGAGLNLIVSPENNNNNNNNNNNDTSSSSGGNKASILRKASQSSSQNRMEMVIEEESTK